MCSFGGELGQLSFTTANIREEKSGNGCTDSPTYYFSAAPLAVGGEVTFDVEGYPLGSSDTAVLVGDACVIG